MPNFEQPDIEPQDTSDTSSSIHREGKGRRAFTKIRRELLEDELSSPSVQRMLLDELERLEEEKSSLIDYRSHFHTADKNAAILAEKLKANVSQEIIFGVCLSIGAAVLGYVPSLWDSQPDGYMALGIGIVLILAGIASKVAKG